MKCDLISILKYLNVFDLCCEFWHFCAKNSDEVTFVLNVTLTDAWSSGRGSNPGQALLSDWPVSNLKKYKKTKTLFNWICLN